MITLPASKRVPAAVSSANRPPACGCERDDFLAEMQARMERLDLLEQAVDEFLRAADRQRRDVVDRLVRVELGALAAGMRQRIHDLAFHAEEPELENREQSDRTGADDHAFRLDGWHGRHSIR